MIVPKAKSTNSSSYDEVLPWEIIGAIQTPEEQAKRKKHWIEKNQDSYNRMNYFIRPDSIQMYERNKVQTIEK